MSELEKTIGKITGTYLGYEDHGMFSVNINFDYGSSSQGTGHYCLDDTCTAAFIKGVLNAVGVQEWGELVGKTVYVLRDQGWNGQVRGIAPLPTEKGEEFLIADAFPSVTA